MKSRILLFILIFAAFGLFYSQISYVYAQEVQGKETLATPTFPNCNNPQGALKVSYATGIHGIPGSASTNTGSDAVYNLSEITLTQCFCSLNGDGTQTNWWKVSSLTIEQIEFLLAQGWVYIPDGSAWGLDEDPYVAFNSRYACEEDDDGDDNDENENDDSDHDKKDKKKMGSVLGIGGQVLGLATTGNISSLYLFLGTGVTSAVLLSILLIKKEK